jgi:hypothetical protein
MEEAAEKDVAMVVVAAAAAVVEEEAGLAATTLLSVAIAAGKWPIEPTSQAAHN